jgi:hypothetical protein
MFVMPMMSTIYNLSTVEERNDKGSWFGWEVSKSRVLNPSEQDDKALFDMAIAFGASVKAGEIKVKQEAEDVATGSVASDDDIPF